MPLSPKLQSYVDSGFLSTDEATLLPYYTQMTLEEESIYSLVLVGELSIKQALAIDDRQRQMFKSAFVWELISTGIVKAVEILDLDLRHDDHFFDVPPVGAALGRGRLDNCFGPGDPCNFKSDIIRRLIVNRSLSLKSAFYLSWSQLYRLETPFIHELIANGSITVSEALALNYDQMYYLDQVIIRTLVSERRLTLAELSVLDGSISRRFEDPVIRQLFTQGRITFTQVSTLKNNPSVISQSPVYEAIMNGDITINQALEIDDSYLNEGFRTHRLGCIFELINHHVLTVDQVLELRNNFQVITALEDPDSKKINPRSANNTKYYRPEL